jgi:hypothetical protein
MSSDDVIKAPEFSQALFCSSQSVTSELRKAQLADFLSKALNKQR